MRMIPPPSEIRTDLLTLGFEQSNWAADILTDLKLWATSKLLRISIDFPQAKYCCSHFYIDLQPSSDPKTSTLNCFCPAGLNYSRSSRNQTSFRSISHCFLLSVIGTRSYLYFYLLCFERQPRAEEIQLLPPCERQQQHKHFKTHCIIYLVASRTAQVESEWFKKLGGAVREIISSSSPRLRAYQTSLAASFGRPCLL